VGDSGDVLGVFALGAIFGAGIVALLGAYLIRFLYGPVSLGPAVIKKEDLQGE